MKAVKRIAVFLSLVLCGAFIPATSNSQNFEPLAGPGKKSWIGREFYVVYSFDKKPQMGIVILKLELYDKDNKKNSSFTITGNLDMPSMKGAHTSGDHPFVLNRKGDYLLPLDLVMPGEWEVQLVFTRDTNVIYRGSIRIHV